MICTAFSPREPQTAHGKKDSGYPHTHTHTISRMHAQNTHTHRETTECEEGVWSCVVLGVLSMYIECVYTHRRRAICATDDDDGNAQRNGSTEDDDCDGVMMKNRSSLLATPHARTHTLVYGGVSVSVCLCVGLNVRRYWGIYEYISNGFGWGVFVWCV